MDFTMKFDQQVAIIGISSEDAAQNPAAATLTNITLASSDTSIFTVAADPANPDGPQIITGVAVGTANLAGQATATEPDGTVHTVGGTASITLTPDVPPAASLVFTFGTPTGPAGSTAAAMVSAAKKKA